MQKDHIAASGEEFYDLGICSFVNRLRVRTCQSYEHIGLLISPIEAPYFSGDPCLIFHLTIGGVDIKTPGSVILRHLDNTFLEVNINYYHSTSVKVLVFVLSFYCPKPFPREVFF